MTRKHLSGALATLAFAALVTTTQAADKEAVKLTQLDDRVRVEINGQLFTEYIIKNTPRPYCYPVIGPAGVPMTRNFPMKDVEGEDKDHKHHRSLWYAHGDVNGVDFWSEDKEFGKTVHDRFLEVKSGAKFGIIRAENKWVKANGDLVMTEERTIRFHADKTIDWDMTFKASQGQVTFGDTKEGSMSLRLNENLRFKPNKGGQGKGKIVMSTGTKDEGFDPKVRDTKTWGKRAAWVDYSGPVDGRVVGAAIFDHPHNPVHPTYWHVRDYGLFSANPFGIHDFEKKPKGTGDLVIPAGKSLTFRYRVYLHEGDEVAGKVAAKYEAYAKPAVK
jgi:hypothetical protein